MTKRIGLFLVSDQMAYQRLLAEDALRAAQKAHIDLDVFSADDTAAQQSNQIVKFLHAHPDEQLAIISMPVMDIGHEQPLENLGRKVLSRGVAWMLLNRDVEPHVLRMRGEFPSLPVGLVTIDNLEIGRIQGRQVKSLLPAKGATILHVLGSTMTSAARDRAVGLREVVTPFVTLYEVQAMWSPDAAEKLVARWLSSAAHEGALHAIVCQNDPMAVGARRALVRLSRERNKPEWRRMPLLGVDGLLTEGRRLVDERALVATVIVPPTSGRAVELLAKAWQSQTPVPQKVVLEPKPYPA